MQTTEGDYGDLMRADAAKKADYIKRLESRVNDLQIALFKACEKPNKDPRHKMFANLAESVKPEPREPTAEELAEIEAARNKMVDDAHARFPIPPNDCKQIACDFITIDPDGFGSVNDGVGDADAVRKFILSARELAGPMNMRLGRMHIRFALYEREIVPIAAPLIAANDTNGNDCAEPGDL